MLLSIQSTKDKRNDTDAEGNQRYSYSKIRANINIPWECKYIKYHISSLNTKANILITTNTDKIVIDSDKLNYEITFDDKYSLSEKEMMTKLEKVKDVFLSRIENKKIVITPVKNFSFIQITHRARLVTGLIDAPLNVVFETGNDYIFDIPILDYANKLYLISKQGKGIISNIGDREYNPSVIGNVDTFIKDGVPVIVNFETFGKPIKNIVNIDSFKTIELELVDFMYEPIILNSPMFVTMKIKPVNTPHVRLNDD